MGGPHTEMLILAIHGELIPGSGLYKILSKSKILGLVIMLKQLCIVSKWQHQQYI